MEPLTVETVALAISLIQGPWAKQYAKPVYEAARLADVDPLMMVAYVQHESSFRARVSSRDGEDWGLGQVRARHQAPCSDWKSRACEEEKQKLLNPSYNLRVVAGKIRHIKNQKPFEDNPVDEQWLAGLAGTTNPSHRRVKEIMKIHATLRERLETASNKPDKR